MSCFLPVEACMARPQEAVRLIPAQGPMGLQVALGNGVLSAPLQTRHVSFFLILILYVLLCGYPWVCKKHAMVVGDYS